MRAFAGICHGTEHRHNLTLSSIEIEEEFGRFKIWAGNLGALAKGHSALDWRLRDAEVMRSTVLSLLQELNSALELGEQLRHVHARDAKLTRNQPSERCVMNTPGSVWDPRTQTIMTFRTTSHYRLMMS